MTFTLLSQYTECREVETESVNITVQMCKKMTFICFMVLGSQQHGASLPPIMTK